MPQRRLDVAALESELATVRAEQKRLAKAVALSDEIPELVSERSLRSQRPPSADSDAVHLRDEAELADPELGRGAQARDRELQPVAVVAGGLVKRERQLGWSVLEHLPTIF
jgi:hypothetical protein